MWKKVRNICDALGKIRGYIDHYVIGGIKLIVIIVEKNC